MLLSRYLRHDRTAKKMGNYLDVLRKITNFALCIAKNHKNNEEADVCKQIKL